MDEDVEAYKALIKMLPSTIDTSLAESALHAGEAESAISDLLEEAYSKHCLTDNIIEFIESRYDSGPASEVLNGLKMWMGS